MRSPRRTARSRPLGAKGFIWAGAWGIAAEERGLGPEQVLDRLVEVAARRVGDPVDAVAVGHDAQVVGEHGLAAVARVMKTAVSASSALRA